MKKLKLLLLIAGALSMWQLKAQTGTSCSNAVLITQPHAQVYIGNTTFQWYKFDATYSNMRLNISEKSNQINISKIELYSGSCTTLTLLTKDSLTFNLDSVKTIQSSSITIGTSYFVKVSFINAQMNNSYSFNLSSTLIPFCTFCITDYVTGLSLGCYAGCAIPIPTITICAGTTICIGFDCQLLVGSQTFTFSNGDLDVTVGPGFACGLYTPSTTGLITVGMPYYVAGDWPCAGDMLYINVLGATPPPLFTISPSNPICLSSCLTFSSLNIPSSITSYSFNAPGTFMTGPPSNCLKYSTPGSHVIEYILNPNQTCSVVATYTAVVLEPAVSFTMSSANCTLDRTFTAFDNCNSTSTFGVTYDWYIYTGSSSAGTLLYSTTFGSNILSYTFPASGIYYVEVHSSLGGILGQIITITPTSPAVPTVITNTLSSLCNLPTDSLVTLNPNVVLGTSTAIWSAIDATTGLPLTIPFIMGVNGIITYNLSGFSSYTAPINFCINICDLMQCVTIYPCCPTPSGTILYSNTTFTTNTNLGSAGSTLKYHFSGTNVINAGVTLNLMGTEVTFDPNAKIIVKGILNINFSYLHACSAMWDGIYLYNGSKISIGEAGPHGSPNTIEDAKRAIIDTLGASRIFVDFALFNKNYESIVLKREVTTSDLAINGNLFTCSVLAPNYRQALPTIWSTLSASAVGALAPTFMLPPYISRKSYSGITLYQTKTSTNPNQFVQIAGNNLFDKLQFGIVATRSRFTVQGNRFQNITAGKGFYAAIYLYGNSGAISPIVTPLLDATIGYNTMENCKNGVYNIYNGKLSVTNNTLTLMNAIGVFVNKNPNNIIIDKNKFNQCLVGINLFDNGRIKADVTNNRIVNATTVGIYNNNYGIFVGEVIPATSASSIINRYHNIYNNYIEGYYNGMYVSNTYSTQIEDNEAHIMADNTAGNFQMGIRVEGTNKINIKNNIVDKPLADNSAWWQYGIFLDGNTIPAIKCNSINNFYASVKFQMLNYVAPGNGLIFNSFSNYNHAIWLDQNAEIGDQYFSFLIGINNASMNQWLTPPPPLGSQTYASNSSNQTIASGVYVPSKLYTSSTGTYYLNNSLALFSSFGHTLLRGVGYSPIYISCPPSIPTPLMFRSANIALNNLSYGINTTNLLHVSNRMLVKNLKTECINLSLPTNAMYKNFIDSTYNKSVGQFYRVDSLLNLGMSTGSLSTISQAKLLNTSISVPNLLEQNQKWLNATYIDMQTVEPDSTILLMLEQLAIKCPQYDGEAVYQARSLLMYYFGKSYNSICDMQNIQPSGSRLSNVTDKDSSSLGRSGGASVYPNPTTKDITVTYTKGDDAEAAVFEVYNMVGELILIQTLKENITKLSLSDLSSGIYIYFIKQDGITLQTNKLVLTK